MRAHRPLSLILATAVGAVLSVAGCKKEQTPPGPAPSPGQAAPAAKSPAGLPPGGAASGAAAQAAPAPPIPAGTRITGKVTELLKAPPYVYLRVKAADGDVWVAVPSGDTKVGDQVNVAPQMPMDGFHSATLNRTFDTLFFGTLVKPGEAAPTELAAQAEKPVPPGASGAGHPGTPAPGAAQEPIKVAPAKGGDARTVAQIVAQRQQLKDKAVQVRGKVVKVNNGILGRNWLHVRDGSAKDGTDDIAVTTDQTAAVGDVVLVHGTVAVDRDFGAGYAYEVLIENAKLVK